jgi:hypothetical protein
MRAAAKTIFKTLLLILVVAVAIPLARYHTVRPCGILEKELVRRIEEGAHDAREQAEDAAAAYGTEARDLARDVGDIVEGGAVGVAVAATRARVRRMSEFSCARELWKAR